MVNSDLECISDAEEGSCYSQFYSSYDDLEIGNDSDCSVDVVVVRLGNKPERDCRICQLSLVDDGDGDGIELGCCCKDDLAVAHKHCAETWFKIKGNKTCEICNSMVTNLVVPNETLPAHGTTDVNPIIVRSNVSMATRSQGCINGHRLLNFILACLVFAFVISWLFHFNIPS